MIVHPEKASSNPKCPFSILQICWCWSSFSPKLAIFWCLQICPPVVPPLSCCYRGKRRSLRPGTAACSPESGSRMWNGLTGFLVGCVCVCFWDPFDCKSEGWALTHVFHVAFGSRVWRPSLVLRSYQTSDIPLRVIWHISQKFFPLWSEQDGANWRIKMVWTSEKKGRKPIPPLSSQYSSIFSQCNDCRSSAAPRKARRQPISTTSAGRRHRSSAIANTSSAIRAFIFFGLLVWWAFRLLALFFFWVFFGHLLGALVHGYTPGCGGHERGHWPGSQWHGWHSQRCQDGHHCFEGAC